MNKDKETIYEKITNKIIEKLEKGIIPWEKPWSSEEMAPKNLVTQRAYTGINSFHLATEGFRNPNWLTFKQAKDLGGTIKKGEHGTSILYTSSYQKDIESLDGTIEEKSLKFLKFYTVFNVAQTEGVEIPEITESCQSKQEKNELAELIISSFLDCPKIISGNSLASYSPKLDIIYMPNKKDFKSLESYYSTLFHELIHSTGHSSRLNREGVTNTVSFGSKVYSKEELIAEMGAAFLCAYSDIENTIDSSVGYLQHWIKQLKADSKLIIQAASQAQKASDLILKNRGIGAI